MGRRLEVTVLHCSACGAPVAAAAKRCDHCAAPIAWHPRDLDRVCIGCGARMARAARYCAGCGGAVPEQSITPFPVQRDCPRCSGALRQRDLGLGKGGGTLIECAACHGAWLAPAVFDHFCQRAEAAAAASAALRGRSRRTTLAVETAVRYLACPDCGQRMLRRNWGGVSGIVVDVCVKHGLWFDSDELAQVVAFLRDGGREQIVRAQAREAHAARERLDALPALDLSARAAEPFDLAERLATVVGDLAALLFRRKPREASPSGARRTSGKLTGGRR